MLFGFMLQAERSNDRLRPVHGIVMAAGHRLPGTRQHQQLFHRVHQLIDTAYQWRGLRGTGLSHQFQMEPNPRKRRT